MPKNLSGTKPLSYFTQHLLNFNQKLGKYDLCNRNVRADGNCLFRAVADQINGDEKDHNEYRALAIEEIKQNKGFYQEFLFDDVNQYIKLMSKDGTWGGHLELQALSQVLKIPIIVHDFKQILVIGKYAESQQDSSPTTRYKNGTHENVRILKNPSISQQKPSLSCIQIIQLNLKRILVKMKILKHKAEVGTIKSINIAFHQGPNIIEHYTSIRFKSDSLNRQALGIPTELIRIMMIANKQSQNQLDFL